MKSIHFLFLSVFISSSVAAQSQAQALLPLAEDQEYQEQFKMMRYRPAVGDKGMVVSSSRLSAEYGAKILRQGGNAVDAAVATALAMAVTEPENASLGGGGFMLYCPNGQAQCEIIDFREKAPQSAHRDMYLKDGKADPKLSREGALASGVPGVVAGLLSALEKWGKFSRQRLLKTPIEWAKNGHPIDSRTQEKVISQWPTFNKEAKKIFSCGNRHPQSKEFEPCRVGQKLLQKDLARVLETLSAQGRRGFYQGWVADKIVAGLKSAGGILTKEDLKNYQVAWREPLRGKFMEYEIFTMPPPSAGGTNLLAMFHYLQRAHEGGQLKNSYGSVDALHAMAQGMSLAFADRAHYFGDADHYPVPFTHLISPAYLDQRWKLFSENRNHIPPSHGTLPEKQRTETTHFSVMDATGNAVALTTTINYSFGSGFVPPGTGVMMNDQMDDFSAQPGTANIYGLVQGEANAIQPGKRPLSSMAPTIVRDQQMQNRIVIGAQGGPRITTSVFQNLVNRLYFKIPLPDAVAAPRFHHQWRPAALFMETGFAHEVREALQDRGWEIKDTDLVGQNHAIERFPKSGRIWGVADPRGPGQGFAE